MRPPWLLPGFSARQLPQTRISTSSLALQRACFDYDDRTRRPSVSSGFDLTCQRIHRQAPSAPRDPGCRPNAIPSDSCVLGCDYIPGIPNMVEDNINLQGASSYRGNGGLG